MIEEIRNTVMTCDFCGKEIEQASYPKNAQGQETTYSLCFSHNLKEHPHISEPLVERTGHMCWKCRQTVLKMCMYGEEASK